jgi:hypothetical protein
MENNAGDLGFAVSSLELLNNFSAVGGIDFDDVSSSGG